MINNTVFHFLIQEKLGEGENGSVPLSPGGHWKIMISKQISHYQILEKLIEGGTCPALTRRMRDNYVR
jgi:hypothetical protein